MSGLDVVFKLSLKDEQYAAVFARDQQLADTAPYPLATWLGEITPARNVEVVSSSGVNTVEFTLSTDLMSNTYAPQADIVDMINGYAGEMSLADIDTLAQKTLHLSHRAAGCRWTQKVTK